VATTKTILVMPLLSNAKAMVTGRPIEAVRRRLKFASVFYDSVYLEAGTARISAGPHLSAKFKTPRVEPEVSISWQTPAQRARTQRGPFSIGVGREDRPGVPAKQIDIEVVSDTSIAWVSTFEPFRAELPRTCDWITYGVFGRHNQSIAKLTKHWADADGANPALERALPVRFARQMVIDNANEDLATIFTAQPKMSASFDTMHSQVVAQRLSPDSGLQVTGFAVPILFPTVGSLTWDEIAALRRDRHIARFRSVMHEVEVAALDEAAMGDVEAAAHHIYEGYIAKAATPADGIVKTLGRATIGMIISGGRRNCYAGPHASRRRTARGSDRGRPYRGARCHADPSRQSQQGLAQSLAKALRLRLTRNTHRAFV
jgi:hypothetical protein